MLHVWLIRQGFKILGWFSKWAYTWQYKLKDKPGLILVYCSRSSICQMGNLARLLKIKHEFRVNKHVRWGRSNGDSLWTILPEKKEHKKKRLFGKAVEKSEQELCLLHSVLEVSYCVFCYTSVFLSPGFLVVDNWSVLQRVRLQA